jgi:acyl-coenzyme A thioesterase PaaI-like protein
MAVELPEVSDEAPGSSELRDLAPTRARSRRSPTRACGYAAYTGFPEDRDVLTVDLSMSLVAPAARPAFVAAGRVIRSGRTLTFCRGEVYGVTASGDREVIALIQATMMAVTRMSA